MPKIKPQMVQAMAIGGGKVLAVGNNEEITRLAGPKTQSRDLDSATTSTFIFPGFNDAHTHLGGGRPDPAQSRSDRSQIARRHAHQNRSRSREPLADGHWITGGRWDHTLWPEKVFPRARIWTRSQRGHPAFLDRVDGHIAIVNSAALAAAGITGKTTPPQGGAIDLDANGEPTGILRESATDLVEKVIPPPTPEERRRGAELAIADALAHGVTSVQDFSDWNDFLVFEQMEKEGKLHLRISEWLPFSAPLDELKTMRAHHDVNDPMLHTGMLKGFMDGSLGSRTAAMKAPFADDPGNSGLPQYPQDELNKMAVERAQAGFQLGFHAIGDKAAAMALEAFSQPGVSSHGPQSHRARAGGRSRGHSALQAAWRYRIMQPNHLLTDMNWAEDRLGPQTRSVLVCVESFPRCRSAAGVRHGLSRRAHHAISRPLRRSDAQE